MGVIIADSDKTIYYVSEYKGLIKFDLVTGKPTYLCEEFNGEKLRALNGLSIDEEKQIVFVSECSSLPIKQSGKDILLKRPSGKILSFDLKTNEAKLVLDNLAYPNGIAFHKPSQSIIFAEMTHHSIRKYAVY